MLDLNKIMNIHVGNKFYGIPSYKILCQSLLYGKYCKLQQNEFIEVYIYIYTRYNEINISENSLIITIYVNTSNLHFTILI